MARCGNHRFMHRTIEPTILYFGTPVALISTLNEDNTPNIAPMSSAWWLGWSCMLGLGSMGKTSDNLIRTRECVINLPSEAQVTHVDRLALTTGKNPGEVHPSRLAESSFMSLVKNTAPAAGFNIIRQ